MIWMRFYVEDIFLGVILCAAMRDRCIPLATCSDKVLGLYIGGRSGVAVRLEKQRVPQITSMLRAGPPTLSPHTAQTPRVSLLPRLALSEAAGYLHRHRDEGACAYRPRQRMTTTCLLRSKAICGAPVRGGGLTLRRSGFRASAGRSASRICSARRWL